MIKEQLREVKSQQIMSFTPRHHILPNLLPEMKVRRCGIRTFHEVLGIGVNKIRFFGRCIQMKDLPNRLPMASPCP